MFIEIVYVDDTGAFQKSLEMPMGSTVLQAVEQSGLLEQRSDVAISRDRLAVFGQRVSADTVLSDGDRVEVLRPLAISAAEARRLRAARRA